MWFVEKNIIESSLSRLLVMGTTESVSIKMYHYLLFSLKIVWQTFISTEYYIYYLTIL